MSELKMPENTFGYVHNGSTVIWNVEDIWRAADSLKITTLDIDYFHEMMANVQLEYDEDDWRRVEEADLSYPPIISSGYNTVEIAEGSIAKVPFIIDGCHRLAKMIDLDKKWVDVKIMHSMPTPLYVKGKPFLIEGLNFTWRAKSVSNESFTQDVKWLEW